MRPDQVSSIAWNIAGAVAALFAFSLFVIADDAINARKDHECLKLSNGETLQSSQYPWNCTQENK